MPFVVRASIFVLLCAANLLAQRPAPEKYHLAKVEKITAYPQFLIFVYLLGGGTQCELGTRLYVKEGAEIKAASEGDKTYVMDTDGLVYKCGFTGTADHVGPGQRPNKK